MINKIQLQLDENMKVQRREWEDICSYLKLHSVELYKVYKALSVVDEWLVNTVVCHNSIDLSYAGDRHVLSGIFKAFRTMGYEPGSRPTKGDSEHSCYFDKTAGIFPRFYLNFSSTKCRRIKVGTEMVKQTIYETVCDEEIADVSE